MELEQPQARGSSILDLEKPQASTSTSRGESILLKQLQAGGGKKEGSIMLEIETLSSSNCNSSDVLPNGDARTKI